jgi:hypothetical protein
MRKPEFKLGDHVRESFPIIGKEAKKGVVTDSYESSGQQVYIVACVSGREAVFFERELTLDARSE